MIIDLLNHLHYLNKLPMIIKYKVMLTNAFRVLVKNPVKKSFYGKRNKNN